MLIKRDLLYDYIKDEYPSHKNSYVWSSFEKENDYFNFEFGVIQYDFIIDDRICDNGFVYIDKFNEWKIDKRDLKIDKIIYNGIN